MDIVMTVKRYGRVLGKSFEWNPIKLGAPVFVPLTLNLEVLSRFSHRGSSTINADLHLAVLATWHRI